MSPSKDDVWTEPEYLEEEESGWTRAVGVVQRKVSSVGERFATALWWGTAAVFAILVHAYVVWAAVLDTKRAAAVITLLALAWIYFLYNYVFLKFFSDKLTLFVVDPILHKTTGIRSSRVVQIGTGGIVLLAMIAFVVVDTWNEKIRLVGLGGIAAFIVLMFILSNNRRKIRWRVVLWGFLLQFVLGLLVLRWSTGATAFSWFSDQIVTFLDYTNNGTVFVYGFLATPPNICGMSPVFAFTILQVVIYFGSVVALLYYYGIMQSVVKTMARFMQFTLGTTAAESLNACACIFLGQTEAPMLIRPYLARMTTSELHAVMTSGFSCIAGSLFAAYISFGACPSYLLSSTVMSAPGSLACSKIMYPEDEESEMTKMEDLELPKSEESTPLESISNGAIAASEIVLAIIANLVVFLAILAFINNICEYIGELIGHPGWSFELIIGYVFFPAAYVMGVTNTTETLQVARLMGTKTTLNEFVAYQQLAKMITADPPALSPRSTMIATYALCGFSNFSSIGIQLAVLGQMMPEKKRVLARIALRSLLAGCISCFLTASLAGVLVSSPVHCPPVTASADCFDPDYYQRLIAPSPSPSTPLPIPAAHFLPTKVEL